MSTIKLSAIKSTTANPPTIQSQMELNVVNFVEDGLLLEKIWVMKLSMKYNLDLMF